MSDPIYAHSLTDRPLQEWQTLTDHSYNVASQAAKFAESFSSGNWAWNLGWLHDLGKVDVTFQRYLIISNGLNDRDYDTNGRGKVNHSSAGMAYALKSYPPVIAETLAYIVAGHHAGLPDYDNAETPAATISGRKEEGLANLAQIDTEISPYIEQLKELVPPPFIKPESYHLWVRMLFSCLVDADYLDTEAFMNPEQALHRGKYQSIADLKIRFDEYMNGIEAKAEPSSLNNIRRDILASCRRAAQDDPGLYSLTVPTGGGKTLSAMAFALDHALRHGKSKVVVVIPYTSIIEQTASIFSTIFGADQVIEHHSNLSPDRETQRMRLASENWDAPIIVTTNVQFFESLFAAKPSQCRKIHNIADSIVILDEAQMLPTEKLSPCVSALNILVRDYKTTIVLTTATQPALQNLPPEFVSLGAPKEIIENVTALYRILKRVNYHFPDPQSPTKTWEEVAEELQQHSSVLCIVNKRQDCFELFNLMPKGTIHLSALMCGQHKSEVINRIKEMRKAELPVRVISTQLVEAGVDMDFPVVYRALAGIDSIAQAAGRCNREGKLEAGEVYIFVPPKPAPKGLLRKGEDTTREMLYYPLDMNSPDCYHAYFTKFYHKATDLGKQFHKWLEGTVPYIPFRTVGQEFQLINDAQRPVIVRYGDSDKWIRQLQFAGPTREIMRVLQRYNVNLPRPMIDTMLNDGRIVLANPEQGNDILLQGTIRYDPVFGLDVFNHELPLLDI